MADKTPVRVVFDSGGTATGLGEFQTGETVPVANGGTGLSSLGSALQTLRVNAAGNAFEFAAAGGDLDIRGDDSTSMVVALASQTLQISGDNSITTSTSSSQTLSITLDNDIFVNSIASNDSTAIQINDAVNVSGALSVGGTLDVNTIASSDSSGVFINDSLFVSGDIKAEGSTAVVFKDKVAVNEIIPDDSSAVQIAVLDVHNIINSSSSFIQIGEGLNVNGSIQTNGSVTAGTSFIIGDADINETDLEKLDGITNGAGLANKALVLDASADVASGLRNLTASGTITAPTVDTNVLQSTDSTAIQVNEGLNVSGTLSANNVDTNTITSTDSSGVTVNDNLSVAGDLYINGSTTTISTTNTTVTDNLFELNTGTTSNNNDIGFIFERGSTGDNATIIWDESADEFVMGTTTDTAGDKSTGITVTAGTLAISKLKVDDITGNDSSAVQIPTLDVNVISNTASSAIQVNEAVNVSGALSVGGALDVNTIASTDSTGVLINDTLYVTGSILGVGSSAVSFGGERVTGVANPSNNDDVVNLGYFNDNSAQNGFPNSTTGSFPLTSSSDSSATDFNEGEDFVGQSASVDAFNVSLVTLYDCMEPIGSITTTDFGASETHVGA